jgi:hypothetical protein
MKAYKKSQIAKTTTCRKEYKVITRGWDDPYWDEYINYYPKYRRGYKNSGKRIMSYQVRMYKTWKHNRKTQWKNDGKESYS